MISHLKRSVFYFILITLSASCELLEISPDRMLIKEFTDPKCFKDRFEYENDKLSSFQRLFGERLSTQTFFYYQDNLLTRVESTCDNGIDTFIGIEYDNNGRRINQTNEVTKDGEIIGSTLTHFTYDVKGNLHRTQSTYPIHLNQMFPTEKIYEWENGNLVKVTHYYINDSGKHFSGNTFIEYDRKKNYTNQELAFMFTSGTGLETVLSKNNVISSRYEFGQVLSTQKYELTYNKHGYPTSQVRILDNQIYPIIHISY